MLIKIMTQNVARGALHNSHGEYLDRWPLIAERISKVQPDILLLQELNNWKDYGHKQLVRACNDLNLEAAPLSPTETGYGTGLFYRHKTVGRWQYHNNSLSHATTHGFSVTGFDIGLPELLIVAPVHLSFYSAGKAAEEAQLVISKTLTKSPFVVIGGDINCAPALGPDIDFGQVPPYGRSARSVIENGEQLNPHDMKSNRLVAWTLQRADLQDAAAYLYQLDHDEQLLAATAGSDQRIDQFWLSSSLAPGLLEYKITQHNPQGSDHHGVAITIDTEKVKTPNWEQELL